MPACLMTRSSSLAVAEQLARLPRHPRLVRVGHEGRYPLAGSYADLIRSDGLDAEGIRGRVVKLIQEEK